MRARLPILVLILASLVAVACTAMLAKPPKAPGAEKFEIALIGDIPYDDRQQTQTANLFRELDREKLAFVAHDGDIKSGSSPCTDEVFRKEYERFEDSRNPLVYTPGDNEWTDCHRTGSDPNERLREVFFANPDESLGEETIRLGFQSEEYPENARWVRGGVTFATLHVVGSNNGLTPQNDQAEYAARNEANLAWLAETFEEVRANNSPAVMLVIQANPFEEDASEPSGFTDFKAALERETVAFGKPVVLVHGDSHTFRIDKPVISSGRPLNFTRVETFGSPDVHWVRATVDARNPEVLSFETEIVEENAAS